MRIYLVAALCAIPLFSQMALHIDLSGPWRVSYQDNPGMSRPDFDDTRWQTVLLPWRNRPAGELSGWLRKRVDLPEGTDRSVLALTLGPVRERYALYINGVRIAEVGSFDSFSDTQFARPRTFPIPAEVAGSRGPLFIAVRFGSGARLPREFNANQKAPYLLTYRSNAPPDRSASIFALQREKSTPAMALAALFLLMMIPLGLAWYGEPTRKELFWLAAFLLGSSLKTAHAVLAMTPEATVYNQGGSMWVQSLLRTANWALLVSFVIAATGFRWTWLRNVIWLGWLANAGLEFTGQNMVAAYLSLGRSAMGIALVILGWAWWRLGTSHRLLLIFASLLVVEKNLSLWQIGTNGSLEGFVNLGFYNASISDLLTFFVTLSMLALLLGQVSRERQDRERLRGEMEAGRDAQIFLLGNEGVALEHGYEIETVYKPALEVGGDFHWRRFEADGSLVLVCGDVSGKGLKAALLVSVAIGILRNEKSSSPAAILCALNEGLVGHTGGGFVTCCCARFDADGKVTIANAGNPSPYCDGREVAVESGLPLGVVAGVTYEESCLRGEHFTFVSDGVVEAENVQRELFGFERTREISTQPAAQIAEAARAWGQTDDITVVTIRRVDC